MVAPMVEERIAPDAIFCPGDSGHLVVAFASIMSSYTRQFEFKTMLTGRGDALLLLRDTPRLSFHGGISGVTDSIESNVEFLHYLRRRTGAERMTFLGICTGGYAAILHGILAGADDVLTANPRTYADYETARRLNCGPRIPRQFDPIHDHYARLGVPPRYLDLARVFEEHADTSTVGPVVVHYSQNLRMDSINARNIADARPVLAVPQESPTHEALGPILRDRGVLEAHLATPPEGLAALYRRATA